MIYIQYHEPKRLKNKHRVTQPIYTKAVWKYLKNLIFMKTYKKITMLLDWALNVEWTYETRKIHSYMRKARNRAQPTVLPRQEKIIQN